MTALVQIQIEKAKDEQLHDAVEVSTGQGDIGQAQSDVGRVEDNVLENLVPKFRWQVHHDGGDGGTRNSRGNKHRILDIVDYDHSL
jgi:hypothetical protein